jgi:hypothetical protein
MGRNYYIHITIPSLKFSHQVCHLGRNSRLDFVALHTFFESFDIDDPNYDRLMTIYNKLKDRELNETDGFGFHDLLCDLYTTCTNDLFVCQDEYGNVRSFNEIIGRMTDADTKFIDYDDGTYSSDGIYLSMDTGFE